MGQRQSSKGRPVSSDDLSSSRKAASPTSVDGGRKFDPEFEGPVKKRSCTDVVCCILFLICILLLACVAGWSFLMGDYRRIVFPKDSRGRICGLDYPEKGHLFFFDMLSCLDIGDVVLEYGCPTEQVCVSRCPNYTWTVAEGDTFKSRSKMICQGGFSGNDEPYKTKSVQSLVHGGLCAPKIVPTNAVFWRCVPSGLLPEIDSRTRQSIKYPELVKPPPSYPSLVLGARTIVTKMLEDLLRTWRVILVCIILAAFTSFLWIFLMRLCTRAMVYFTLLIFVGIFGAATGFCFWRYVETKRLSADPPPFFFTVDITVYFRYATTWLALGIISTIILLLVLVIIIFLRKRIALAHFVIGETSKAVAHLPITLLWPIFPFIFITGVIVLWFFVDMNLRSIAFSEGVLFSNSAAEPKAKFSNEWVRWALSNPLKCDPTANTTSGGICHFVKQIGRAYIPWLQVYNFAMCLWLVNFFIALDQATLAGAFAAFYFSDRRRRRRQWGWCGASLILSTFTTALVYHTGSLALGSLLITLFSLIRMILLRLQRKLQLAENPVAKFFLRCMCCCFWCLEKFLRFLNKNAYIIMAIYGYGFCRSARDAFGLILRNVVRVFVVEKTTDFILFVGKLTVCAFSSCLAYAYMSGRISNYLLINPEQGLHLNYMIIPILIIAIASYLVAKAFFTVYEIGVDTIFVCVCEDLERNDGTPEKPYFMGQSMMKNLKKPDMESTN